MTNKFVINSLKILKIKKILLYEMKILVPNYSYLQNPWILGYRLPDPRSLCPQLNLFKTPPLPRKNSGVRDCMRFAFTVRILNVFYKIENISWLYAQLLLPAVLQVTTVDCVWNVMAHAQKTQISSLRRNGRFHLNRPMGVSSVDYWQLKCAHQR